MKTSFWRRWCNSLRNAKQSRPVARARSRRQPLRLEALEDRVTPTLTPQLVLDINPGIAPSGPSQMVAIGSTTYFTADDGVHGNELWKSDGTATGTVLVKDINPGSTGSNLASLTNVNGVLFFAEGDSTNGYQLWKSDGTAAGTVLLKDFLPDPYWGSGPGQLTNVNGTLFFTAYDVMHGIELWKSDGTSAGTTLLKDMIPGGVFSALIELTNVNGTLFFGGTDATNWGLWKSDGTAAGTTFVKGFKNLRDMMNVSGELFFIANDGTTGEELWKSDGTAAGTVLVKDVYPGTGSSQLQQLTNVNGTLAFTNFSTDCELWKSDGTAAGTVMVSAWAPNPLPSNLTNVNGSLFFSAFDDTHAQELWKSDGTAAGTTLVKDIYPGGYFWSYPGYGGGYTLNSSNPSYLTNLNGTLYFTAIDGTNGQELWKSDGTAAGTTLVKDIFPGSFGFNGAYYPFSSSPSHLTNVNGALFFSADDGIHGRELWRLVDDGIPSLTIADVTVTEGHAGTQSATFTVTLSAASDQPVTVAYATADGTATSGSDYQATSDTLTFAPGETSKIITVLVNGDRLAEPNETFLVNLSAPTTATIDDGQGVGTIVDDEPRISISDVTVIEGNTGTRVANFAVTLTGVCDQPVSVAYATSNGSAAAGSDYQTASGTLTIPAGQTTGTITVLVTGDRLAEANESFFVNLSSPTNAIIARGQGVGTILDDEPRVSISDVTRLEGKNRQTTFFVFTVTLSTAYDQPVTMLFATANGTATTSDRDYVAKTGTLTFAPGETSKTITIVVNGDNKKESNETFYLDLFGLSSNSLFTKSRGIGAILNDD